ncbi:MAG: hypothetical protein GC160_08755 [Acidobacteria bacterium]|nr:hypothetical protein [Acidobacteriota bacterium]
MNRRAWRAGLTALLLLLALAGCDEEERPFVEKVYGGKLYRQYFDKDDGEARIETWMQDPNDPFRRFMKVKDPKLAELVDAQGVEVSEDIARTFLREEGAPGVAALLERRPLLYALDVFAADRLLEIDPADAAILDELELPQRSPLGLALSPDHTALYLLHGLQDGSFGDPVRPATVLRIRGNPLRVERRIDLPDGLRPAVGSAALALSPDGGSLYVAVIGRASETSPGFNSEILHFDAGSGALLARIPYPTDDGRFTGLQMSPDGAVLYASGNLLYAIDTLTDTVSAGIYAGVPVSALAIHPSGSTLYAARGFPKGILAIDTATFSAAGEIPIEQALTLTKLTVTGDGRDLFASDINGKAVYHVDTATQQLVEAMETAGGSNVIAVDR